jgi:hypothetical protein
MVDKGERRVWDAEGDAVGVDGDEEGEDGGVIDGVLSHGFDNLQKWYVMKWIV